MVIKKITNGVSFESFNSKALVKIQDQDLSVSIENPKMSVEVNKAGEYEYNDIGITALEMTKEGYKDIVNFLKLTVEGISIGIITPELPSDKELYKDLGNLDILVVPNADSIDLIKKLANYLDVVYIVILQGKDAESVKKSLGLAALTEDKSIKLKSSDIKRGEDDNVVLNGYLLS